ncbi:HNH endonuclease [Sphingorhabdus sp. Alg239-R122]|uniref:HNH endonuclease n=1 Tax=Sphingorhabdus sp. Alg239-R122 TaxID=2305989 RepID=UPI001967A6AE|nr:HNH endonuclease [Sphingorhabdus sp. Alg239-R122]
MIKFAEDLFDNIGIKEVGKTDKDKSAFVLNEDQKDVMTAAGFEPGKGGENALLLSLDAPYDPDGLKLEISYYNSIRQDPKRSPETRMGRDIVHWMNQGDLIAIANIGDKLFTWKVQEAEIMLNELGNNVATEANQTDLLAKARKSKGKPPKQDRIVSDFLRNASVVAGVLSRAEEECEMPGCKVELFKRKDGSTFLEVHHITPLAEEGEDSMINAAALCPMCHRELHFGAQRLEKREVLRRAIVEKEN